ncbi:hypothetical protein ACWGDX_29590 [Streptomyces sp. NPDC055025]
MLEPLTPAVQPYEADSPLAILFGIVDTTTRVSRDEECDGAETAAADHIYTAYTATLAQAVEDDGWTGHPALPDNGIEPGAVACLGGGIWLHHTLTSDPDRDDRGVLTLLAPCTCEHGYVGYELADENDLLEILADLRRTDGRSTHDGDSGGPYCDSVRPSSWAART